MIKIKIKLKIMKLALLSILMLLTLQVSAENDINIYEETENEIISEDNLKGEYLDEEEKNDIEASIIDINSQNSNLLKIFFDKDIETGNQDVYPDIKIFKDLENKNISLDLEDNKLVNLVLENSLSSYSSYSLLSVVGAEWTIDFEIEDEIAWLEIIWGYSQGIEKIVILDEKNLDIYFTQPVDWESIEVKLLKWIKETAYRINNENKKELNVYLENSLNENSKYIVMMFGLSTQEWNNYSITNSIYDFMTQTISEEDLEIPSLEEEEIWEKIDEVALNSAKVPDTWTETWILILTAVLFSSLIYFKKRKS